jgi:hypothetical protein
VAEWQALQAIDQFLREHAHQSLFDGDMVRDFLLDLRLAVKQRPYRINREALADMRKVNEKLLDDGADYA